MEKKQVFRIPSLLLLALVLILTQSCGKTAPDAPTRATGESPSPLPYAIALHGGAGNITPENLAPEKAQAIRHELELALRLGDSMLASGARGLDVVEQVIRRLEDSPLFNAGRGSVFAHDGRQSMDAAIMEGRDLGAGAVAGVTDIRNPISAARAVLHNSPHVLLVGPGASEFARLMELELAPPEYFFDSARWDDLQRLRQDPKMGTVGCVVLDQFGNLAAGTSTGGMTDKRFGRVGDSPIIGAGTYANNASCAISCTGHGEYFIRLALAKEVSALMLHAGLSLDSACQVAIHQQLSPLGGQGGLIAVDKSGQLCWSFNTPGMFRARANAEGLFEVQLFAP